MPRPKHSRRGRHCCERHDGKESRRRGGSSRRLLPQPGQLSGRRFVVRSQNKRPSHRPGFLGAPAIRVTGIECREHRGEDPNQSVALRRNPQPAQPGLRTQDLPRQDAPLRNDPGGCTRAYPGSFPSNTSKNTPVLEKFAIEVSIHPPASLTEVVLSTAKRSIIVKFSFSL